MTAPYAGDPIAAALRTAVADIQAALARIETPARRDLVEAFPGASAVATTGGPVQPGSEGSRAGALPRSGAVSGFVVPDTRLPQRFGVGTPPPNPPPPPPEPFPPTTPVPPPLRKRVGRMREPIRLGEGPPYDFLARP